MTEKNTLYLGYGDLGRRVRRHLGPDPRDIAICRKDQSGDQPLNLWLGAAADPDILARLERASFDQVLLTLTPKAASDQGYREAYVDTLTALVPVLAARKPAPYVVFVSSTSVYAQQSGEWVDEQSECLPAHFSGQRLLEAEALLGESGLPVTLVRAAGIYGPGRDYLLRQVVAGKGGDERYTNRIHVEDAARFIAQLMAARGLHAYNAPIFNLCDSAPVKGTKVRQWLATQLRAQGVFVPQLSPSETARGGHKRVANERLLASGFKLQYPDYQSGYQALVAQFATSR